MPGWGDAWGTPSTIDYAEGAEVGYRWFAATGRVPLFAFGYGLSYTSFDYRDLAVSGGDSVIATFCVVNIGERSGADVPQLYLTATPGGRRVRLLGFERVELEAGASVQVTIEADPRLLARYDGGAGCWRIDAGGHSVAVGSSALAPRLTAEVGLAGRAFGR